MMFKKRMLASALFLVALGSMAMPLSAQSQENSSKVTFREFAVYSNVIFGPLGKQVASVELLDDGATFVVNDIRGKLYDKIWGGPFFSPDGERIAYMASRDGKDFLVDGVQEGTHFASRMAGYARFSPDGRLYHPILIGDIEWKLVIDGVESEIFDTDEPKTRNVLPRPEQIAFTQNPDRVAFAASRDGKHLVVVDGEESPLRFNMVTWLRFSPDGKRLAYWGWNGQVYPPGTRGRDLQGADFKWDLIVDGIVIATGQQAVGPPIFSPDSQQVAHFAAGPQSTRDLTQTLLFLDGREVAEIPEGISPIVGFTLDSKSLVYLTKEDGEPVLQVGDERFGNPVVGFSRDLRRAVFSVGEGDQWRLIEWAPVPKLGPPPYYWGRFHPSGHFAHAEDRRENANIVVDGVRGTALYSAMPKSLAFSEDGSKLNYLARSNSPPPDAGKAFVVMDGLPGPEHERISHPRFSNDGKRVVYLATDGGVASIYIDGEKIENAIDAVFTRDGDDVQIIRNPATGTFKLVVDGSESAEYSSLRRVDLTYDQMMADNHAIFLGSRGDLKFAIFVSLSRDETMGPGDER